jgi:hypothetical protein
MLLNLIQDVYFRHIQGIDTEAKTTPKREFFEVEGKLPANPPKIEIPDSSTFPAFLQTFIRVGKHNDIKAIAKYQ